MKCDQPGSLQFTGAMSIIEALARAGSTTDRAGAEAVIVRSTERRAAARRGGDRARAQTPRDSDVIRVNLQNLQAGGLSQNVTLRSGDTIFVATRGIGLCVRPGRIRG